MHDKVLTVIDGKLVSMEVNSIDFRVVPASEKNGGEIKYGATRLDTGIAYNDPYEKQNVTFSAKEVGRTVWRSREEMGAWFGAMEVEPERRRSE